MKKILFIGTALLFAFTLSGCADGTDDGIIDNNLDDTNVEELGSEESLATLSYLSAGFLDFSNDTVVASNFALMSFTEEEPTVIEGELDEVNIYIDRLKVLIDGGLDNFGSVNEEASDNELYEFKLTFTVNEEVYIIYYNIDVETSEMTGVIVIGDVEYEFDVLDNINQYEHNTENKPEKANENADNGNGKNDDNEELDDDDTEANVEESENDEDLDTEENDDDLDSEENETKMVLVATNGTDTIKIIYKTEVEDGESTIKFYVEQTIDGITKEVTLKITEEENETVVKVKDGEDEYSFKREVEEEGVVYKLQYEVDGVKGMVKITEITDEEGNITYDYFIQEAGRERHKQQQEPKSDGFDDDEDDSTDEDESEV